MKKVIQQTTKIDHNSGEITEETQVIRVPQEPGFVKIYLADILYLNDMPRHLNPILYALLERLDYDGQIILNAALKRQISEKIKLSVSSIDNAIVRFVKARLLFRKDKGLFTVNPYLFGRGKWENIHKLRLSVTYDLKGRTFSAVVEDKPINNEEIIKELSALTESPENPNEDEILGEQLDMWTEEDEQNSFLARAASAQLGAMDDDEPGTEDECA